MKGIQDMDILIKNANLISMDTNREKIEKNMDILIRDDKIVKIDRNIKLESDFENEKTKIINAIGKVVMPGLINTHAHVPMSIFRETLDGYNLQDWLNKKIWPMEDKLTKEDIYYASCLSFLEMIKTGCTTINDMYFFTDEIIKAMKDTGIRLQTTRTLMNMGNEEEGENRLKELEDLLEKYKDYDNKLTFNVGIHGLYTSNEKYVEKCVRFAKENRLPVHIHFCENSKEVKDIEDGYTAKPIEVLKKNFKGIHTILAHGVKIFDEDIEQIKDMDIAIAHCPVSNLKLGCGIANINKMLEKKINVSLGTDGQGSGSNLDLFEAMKYTALLQKGNTEDPEVMMAYDVLKIGTINGAKALSLEEKIGSITEGKQADLIIINLDNILVKPLNDLVSEIVYNIKGSDVETTIVEGRILMENRKLNVGIDEKEVYNKCEEIIKRIS